MSTTLLRDLRSVFGRHQTFPPRYTWIKAGYDQIDCGCHDHEGNCVEHGAAFSDPLVHRTLGTGKNQARAIRFWAEAAGVLTENEQAQSRQPILRTTRFGQFLLSGRHGHDPYLEAVESWWLVHWNLVGPRSMLPAWWAAFHTFNAATFTSESLQEHVLPHLNGAGHDPAEAVLHRDLLALIRTYCGAESGRTKIDDDIDLPMARLGLLRPTPDGYRFRIGPKAALAPEIAAFAMIDFVAHVNPGTERVLVGTAALETGGPGRAFKLTERDLSGLLSDAARTHDDLVAIDRSAAAEQFVIRQPPDQVATELLHRMYQRLGTANPAEPAGGWSVLPRRTVQVRLLEEAEV